MVSEEYRGSLRLTHSDQIQIRWYMDRDPTDGFSYRRCYLNFDTAEKGKVTYTTYPGLMTISARGASLALLLSQPAKVVRSNGTPIPYMKKTSFAIITKAIWRQLCNQYIMLLIIPVFLADQFGSTYQTII